MSLREFADQYRHATLSEGKIGAFWNVSRRSDPETLWPASRYFFAFRYSLNGSVQIVLADLALLMIFSKDLGKNGS